MNLIYLWQISQSGLKKYNVKIIWARWRWFFQSYLSVNIYLPPFIYFQLCQFHKLHSRPFSPTLALPTAIGHEECVFTIHLYNAMAHCTVCFPGSMPKESIILTNPSSASNLLISGVLGCVSTSAFLQHLNSRLGEVCLCSRNAMTVCKSTFGRDISALGWQLPLSYLSAAKNVILQTSFCNSMTR